MTPYQGLILAAIAVACTLAKESGSKLVRKTRGIDSPYGVDPSLGVDYNPNLVSLVHGYLQGREDLKAYSDVGNFVGYNPELVENFNYIYPEVKRYAVKEDVDEGFMTTTRPVYLPRRTTTTPAPAQDGWRPILTNIPRPATGKSILLPQDNQIYQPHTSIKTNYVPVEKLVAVPVPQPYTLPVYQPYPVPVPHPYPVQLPVPVQIRSTVEVPVERPVPVIKHVPYEVIKNEPVPVPVHYPVPVPLYKTKYVVHTKSK